MKPLYRFKYDFPNEKVHKQYINDAIGKLMSEKELYQKYGKYRIVDNWDDFEDGFIHRLNHIQRRNPNFTVTHLVLYDNIFIHTLSLIDLKCKENDLLSYVKTHTDEFDYIENMDLDKFSVVRFKYKMSYKTNYKLIV